MCCPSYENRRFRPSNEGAQEAAAELEATPAEFLGPTAGSSVAGQIEIMTSAATQGVSAVMLSNSAGDQIVPYGAVSRRLRGMSSSRGTR